LLALEGPIGDAFAAAALLGRGFRAAWAGLLSFLGRVCRRHDGGGEVVVVRCGVEVEVEEGEIWEFM
jgi:hypothetical protein